MEVLKMLTLLTLWLVECIETQSVFTKSDFGSDYISRFNGSGCREHPQSIDEEKKQYFRYLEGSDRNSKNVYVGAMNYLYKLDTPSLNCLESFKEEPDYETRRRCRIQGKSDEPDCQNHIRVVMEYPDHLLVCGTGAYAPKKFIVSDSLDLNGTDTGVAMCPFDPYDNYTAILVSDGNPCNATVPYFGTFTDFIKSQPVLYRPSFKCPKEDRTHSEKTTDREDINWFNSPQFVGSFEDQDKVMFFFRETSVEHPTMKNKIYSRVGKVCKQDLGGGYLDMTKKKWLSFQKARLICSVPGNTPYYYDDIYDVYQSGDKFFALFYRHTGVDSTGSEYTHIVASSAVCVYTKGDIEKIFDGKFQYRAAQDRWETLPESSNPNPRLDNCTAHKDDPDIFRDKVSQYQLMAESVQPMYGQPIFYKSGVQFINIAVSETTTSDQKTGRNIYLASNEGEIYDIFFQTFDPISSIPYLTSKSPTIYRPFGSSKDLKYAIWDMKYMAGSLVLGTDYEVTRLDIENFCKEITKIDVCVTNTKCKWNGCSDKCVKASDNITDCTTDEVLDWAFIKAEGVLESLKNVIIADDKDLPAVGEGLYTTLPLQTKVHVDHVIWTRSAGSNPCSGNNVLEEDLEKYAQTKSGDLIIRNVTLGDNNATFTACSFDETNGIKLRSYTIKVAEGNENIIQVWKQQFNEWSTAFVRWKGCAEVHFSSCSNRANGGG